MAVFYADEYQPNFGYPLPSWSKEYLDSLDEEQLKQLLEMKQQVEANAKVEPVEWGWTLPGWKKIQEQWANYTNHVILGGNRCIRGDTPIYDPVLGVTRRIDSIDGEHHVTAWDGRKFVTAKASKPFIKGVDWMWRVELANGHHFVASGEHRVLTRRGWLSVDQLQPGFSLCPPATTEDTCRQGHRPDAPHWTEIPSGSRGDCQSECRLCDEPLHAAPGSGLAASPLPVGAPTHSVAFGSILRSPLLPGGHSPFGRWDDRGNTPSGSRVSPLSPRPSTRDALRLLAGRFVGILCHAFCKPCRSVLRSLSGLVPWPASRQFSAGSSQQRSVHESAQRDILCGDAYITGIYPVGIGVKWDMSVVAHENYVAGGAIHHNSSKSTYCSRLIVDAALNIPEARIRCYHVNEERSIAEQQAMIWEALPARLKALSKHKGRSYSLGYNQKNGFTGGKMVLPAAPGYSRGSEVIFTNYSSYKNDAQTAEGWWAHLIWCDEECPQKLFETLQYRLADARGRLILSFTTLNGWSPLIADIMGRTKVVSKRHAPLLNRDIPDAMESLSRARTRIYFLWTEDQRFIPVDDFIEQVKTRPQEEILARAYGIPTKASESPFPAFDETVHVIPHEEMPWVKDANYRATRYHVTDPSGSKPWFMLWAAVDAGGTIYIEREWPDVSYGEWAEAGEGPEGKPGPGQRPQSLGINDYIDLIHAAEDGQEIFERIIDPRLGAAQVQGKDGATSIITELDDAGMTMIPSPGLHIDHGLMLINSALKFDQSKPISATNRPKLRISDRCQQLIFALKNYTNQGGKDEATKDPIDCLRYLLMSGADYVDPGEMKRGAKTWSY